MKSEEVIKIWDAYKKSDKRDSAFDETVASLSKMLGVSSDDLMKVVARIYSEGIFSSILSSFAAQDSQFPLIKSAAPVQALSYQQAYEFVNRTIEAINASSDPAFISRSVDEIKLLTEAASTQAKTGAYEAISANMGSAWKIEESDFYKKIISGGDPTKSRAALGSIKRFYDAGMGGILDAFHDMRGTPYEGENVVEWAARKDLQAQARFKELVDPTLKSTTSKEFWKGGDVGKSMARMSERTFRDALMRSGIPAEQHAKILARFAENSGILQKEAKAAQGLLALFKGIINPKSALSVGERISGSAKLTWELGSKLLTLIKSIPKIAAIAGVGAAGLTGWKVYDYLTKGNEQPAAPQEPGAVAVETAKLTGNLHDRILQTIRRKRT